MPILSLLAPSPHLKDVGLALTLKHLSHSLSWRGSVELFREDAAFLTLPLSLAWGRASHIMVRGLSHW